MSSFLSFGGKKSKSPADLVKNTKEALALLERTGGASKTTEKVRFLSFPPSSPWHFHD